MRRAPVKIPLGLVVGAALVGLFVGACVLSLFWLPYSPTSMDSALRFASPSLAHPFGCDQFGRDLLARTIAASQPALAVGVGSVLGGAALGLIVGGLAGMGPYALRAPLMRIIDGLMAYPGILLAMMLVLVLGRGALSVLIAIALFMVPTFARLTCQLTLSTRNQLSIKAARSYGMSALGIFVYHVLPNIAPRLVTQLTASAGTAMLLEAALSFLGLGVQPPAASWGYMLSEAMPYAVSHPSIALPAGLALVFCVLGFNLLGDGIGDLLHWRSS